MVIDVRHYADPDHDDYLLLWQYRQSTRFLTLVTAFLEIIQEQLIDPWDDFEAELSISAADDHWLDLLGSRLGLIRPYGERDGRILTWAASSSEGPPRNSNRRYQWSASGSETDEARATQFRGPTGAVGRFTQIDDVQFRKFVLAQVWRDRGGRSVTDIERMAGYIFGADSVWVEELIGEVGIKLHVSTATDTFFTVLENNQFLPKPAGVKLETQWHNPDIFGLWGIQLARTDLIYKINLSAITDRTGIYGGNALPTGLDTPIGSASFQGNYYVVDRGVEDGETDDLWRINPIQPAQEDSTYGRLGVIAISGSGRSNLDYPSGMAQLGSNLYLLDGTRGDNHVYRFTSIDQGSVAAVSIGEYPNEFNSVAQPARSLAGLNGDLYIGFSGGLLCKLDPNNFSRSGDGYGTLSVTAAGGGGTIFGMCPDPQYDDALLISKGGTNPGLWRINSNNFLDTTPPYGQQITTWAAAGIGTPIRSLALI